MAQRSARARSKLDKISGPAPSQRDYRRPPPSASQNHQHYHQYGGGGARLGSGGLLTPSASSVSGSSTRASAPPARIGKGTLRSFFDAQGEKLRGRLAHHPRKDSSDGSQSSSTTRMEGFYTGLGGGAGGSRTTFVSLGSGLGTIGEERIQMKRWEGGGSRGEAWDGGGVERKDLELWFPDGDTLVYLSEKPIPSSNAGGRSSTPQPSFRLRAHVLLSTGSPYLIQLLEVAVREELNAATLPPVEEHPMDYEYHQLQRTRTRETMQSGSSLSAQDSMEAGIRFRLYFPAPARLDRMSQNRYHLTTRNFFAVLCNQSLVGMTLGQALLDLTERIDKYLSPPTPAYATDLTDDSPYGSLLGTIVPQQEEPGPHPNTVPMILQYLQGREFDDVRNCPDAAAGMVVWAESAIKRNVCAMDEQRIESIWREGFVHCTGQLSGLQLQPEWRDISLITKALIDRASLEVQVRVSNADTRLSGFNFNDVWPATTSSTPARAAYDRFQKFLVKHYSSRFGSWPPADGRLTRTLYLHLQRDFTTLYAYLVDRDASWSPPAAQPAPISRSIIKPNNPLWSADGENLPLTQILISFDLRENHPPIPYPMCLSPNPKLGNPAPSPNAPPQKQRFFTASTVRRTTDPAAAAAALALSECTNLEALASSPIPNPLLEAFQQYEKATPDSHHPLLPPREARKGRWVMIYAVLQTLASVAVDAPGIRWTEGVEYWLNPRLRGAPPWRAAGEGEVDERGHWRSYCWVVGRQWGAAAAAAASTAAGAAAGRNGVVRGRRWWGREKEREEDDEDGESSGDEGDDEMEAGDGEGGEEWGRVPS